MFLFLYPTLVRLSLCPLPPQLAWRDEARGRVWTIWKWRQQARCQRRWRWFWPVWIWWIWGGLNRVLYCDLHNCCWWLVCLSYCNSVWSPFTVVSLPLWCVINDKISQAGVFSVQVRRLIFTTIIMFAFIIMAKKNIVPWEIHPQFEPMGICGTPDHAS